MNENTRILVVDDEEIILKIIKEELVSLGYIVDLAMDGEEASKKVNKNYYDLVILDNKMPKKDGIEVLKQIKDLDKSPIIIMMTAFGTIDQAVEAIKLGAYDYITKPFENKDLIDMVEEGLKVKKNVSRTKKKYEDKKVRLIGESEKMLDLKWRIDKIKDLNTTVLITGESGTGKGLIARKIHYGGNRCDKPFIHVNCAVLPENLIESELFGHVKGSFTGADKDKMGKFEQAQDGTIFLDEIGALNYNLQAKLLTVLQERSYERIGSTEQRPVNARILAATNENLEEEVKKNNFREDLYYRLNVVRLECIPLRYRKSDIEELSYFILKNLNRSMEKNVGEISKDVLDLFRMHNWPGNVRELENILESTLALSSSNIINMKDLPLRMQEISINQNNIGLDLDGFTTLENKEKETIIEALKENDGHRVKTAEALGISRRTLQYRIKKYDLY